MKVVRFRHRSGGLVRYGSVYEKRIRARLGLSRSQTSDDLTALGQGFGPIQSAFSPNPIWPPTDGPLSSLER